MPLLEVIACSIDDAIAAERGGAGRLEVVSSLEAGGLTPPANVRPCASTGWCCGSCAAEISTCLS